MSYVLHNMDLRTLKKAEDTCEDVANVLMPEYANYSLHI